MEENRKQAIELTLCLTKFHEDLREIVMGDDDLFQVIARVVVAVLSVKQDRNKLYSDLDDFLEKWTEKGLVPSGSSGLYISVNGFQRTEVEDEEQMHDITLLVDSNSLLRQFQKDLYADFESRGIPIELEFSPDRWIPKLILGRGFPQSGVKIEETKNFDKFLPIIGLANTLGLHLEPSGVCPFNVPLIRTGLNRRSEVRNADLRNALRSDVMNLKQII